LQTTNVLALSQVKRKQSSKKGILFTAAKSGSVQSCENESLSQKQDVGCSHMGHCHEEL
jgi:hypothetical protein